MAIIERINELTSQQMVVTHRNSSDVLVAPNALRWRLDDITNGVTVQVTDWTVVPTPASSNTITITSNENRILTATNDIERRQFLVEVTGTSGEPRYFDKVYEIQNLRGLS